LFQNGAAYARIKKYLRFASALQSWKPNDYLAIS
jgi:hypothetical protein